MKLLLVEDDRECSDFFRAVLERDFEVRVTYKKGDALARLAEVEFDAVVADWALPDGLGTEVLERARDLGTFGVLVTGFTLAEIETRGRFTILFKPVNCDRLLAEAKSLAARTELARACSR